MESPHMANVTANFRTEGLPPPPYNTRFPPEPSGFLHIGHIKAAMLNEYYAKLKNGKIIFRFDDTNPAKENEAFEKAIWDDMHTMGIRFDYFSHTSDYFELIMHYGDVMIAEGKAYIDDLDQKSMNDNRWNGVDSPCRANSIERNKEMWEDMKKGTPEGQKCVMRAKILMKHKNTTMRDPTLFRTVAKAHARTGTRFKVFPSYDFACPIVDSVENVSIAMRTIEYRDRNEQYHWMQDALGLRRVHIQDFSRLNFQYTEMSKRRLQWFVDKGIAEGWDDPRFPTVQGVMRRGMTIPALRAFILEQGPSVNITYQEWDKIWTKNKQVIDPICPHFTAVEVKNAVYWELVDNGNGEVPEKEYFTVVPKSKKNPDAGGKLVEYSRHLLIEHCDAATLKEGEEATLMGWGNVVVDSIRREERVGEDGIASSVITKLVGHLNLTGNFKTTEHKLTWLSIGSALAKHRAASASASASASVDVGALGLPTALLVGYDHLLTKGKLDDKEDYDPDTHEYLPNVVNRHSRHQVLCYVEPGSRRGVVGDIIQYERKGYFCLDKPYAEPGNVLLAPPRSALVLSAGAAAPLPPPPPVAAASGDSLSSSSSSSPSASSAASASASVGSAASAASATASASASAAAYECVLNYIPDGRTMVMRINGVAVEEVGDQAKKDKKEGGGGGKEKSGGGGKEKKEGGGGGGGSGGKEKKEGGGKKDKKKGENAKNKGGEDKTDEGGEGDESKNSH